MTDLGIDQLQEALQRERSINAHLAKQLASMMDRTLDLSTELGQLMTMHGQGEHDAVKARLTVLVTRWRSFDGNAKRVH